MVGWTIRPANPAPIQTKNYWNFLKTNIMDDLVIATLHEGTINITKNSESLRR
jgi:hypothetical protein